MRRVHGIQEKPAQLMKGFVAVCVLLAAVPLQGCSGNASFSKQEMQQIKDGPPKEMPKEAIEVMNRARRQGPPPGAPGAPGP